MSSFKWSFSGLMLFEQCGFKYACERLPEKIAEALNLELMRIPKRTQAPSATRGETLHKQIEVYLRTREPVSFPTEIEWWRPAFEHLWKFPFWPEHKIALDRNWTVVDWDSPQVWVRGIIDLKMQRPDALVGYDWKTGKEYDEHYDQKELYTLLMWAETPAPLIKFGHIYLDEHRTTSRDYSIEWKPAMQASWASRALKLEDATNDQDVLTAFPMTPNRFCKWCQLARSKGGPCKFS